MQICANSRSNVENLNNVRPDASRHFRKKKKAYLNAKIEELETNSKIKILGTCIGALMISRRVITVELIKWKMKRVIWLLTPTVSWLGGGTISLNYWMYIGLMVFGGKTTYSRAISALEVEVAIES